MLVSAPMCAFAVLLATLLLATGLTLVTSQDYKV